MKGGKRWIVMWVSILFLLSLYVVSSRIDLTGRDNLYTYAEIWFHDDTTSVTTPIVVQNYWYNISGFDGGDDNGEKLSGFVHDGIGNLTALIAGMYHCSFSISFGNAGNNQEYQIAVFINNIIEENSEVHRKLGAGGDVGNGGSSFFIDLSVGDVLVLRIKNNDDTADALVHVCNLNLIRIDD